MSKQPKVAFALGGLAGNNAHGAGFLQAALDHGVEPALISCTSGQIRWVLHYLKARKQADSTNALRKLFAQELAAIKKTGLLNLDVALLATMGKKNVFRPSYEHMLPDFLRNAGEVANRLMHHKGNMLLSDQLMSLIPGRSLVPDSPESYFEEIVAEYNAADIGLAFNAYNPQEGVEYVYLNPKAMELMHDPAAPESYKRDRRSEHRPYRYYKGIDVAAVKDALWLYQYGFYDKQTKFVDGAYFRDQMLAELAVADLIFSVRPINHKWLGELPHTYQGVEDLKTEVGFNGTYAAERDQIMLINKLLKKGYLDPSKGRGFHHVELVELEMAMQRGYFDYMLESQDVFDSAEQMSVAKFAELRGANRL